MGVEVKWYEQCRINHVANATGLRGASGSKEIFFQPVSS